MKVFASDLDGTLFFHHLDPQYKLGDIEAIKQFQKDGHLFGCCTGRSLGGARVSFIDLLELDFYIASSGAVITDKDMNILYDCPIPFEVANAICEKYRDQTTIYIQTLEYYTFDKSLDGKFFTAIDSLDDIKNQPIYSVCLISDTDEKTDKIAQELNKEFSEVVGYKNIAAVDIVAKGCSKGVALKKVKEIFNAKTSYGIGDSYNDIPLLEDADISFTFNTSPKEVQDVADNLVDSIEEAMGQIK